MKQTKAAPSNLAQTVYLRLKTDLMQFRLIPGQWFSETETAERMGVSRTPVREALHKLEREGFIEVAARSGWSVKPFDFEMFDHLYDLRLVLETAAVRKLCKLDPFPDLSELRGTWLIKKDERLSDAQKVAALDERFHECLVEAGGNPEMARVYRGIVERIRIIRRMDFTDANRVASTYDEHANILRHVLARRAERAVLLLRTHIEISKVEVRKITLHKLHQARPLSTRRDPSAS